jgi:hypothetical protein
MPPISTRSYNMPTPDNVNAKFVGVWLEWEAADLLFLEAAFLQTTVSSLFRSWIEEKTKEKSKRDLIAGILGVIARKINDGAYVTKNGAQAHIRELSKKCNLRKDLMEELMLCLEDVPEYQKLRGK